MPTWAKWTSVLASFGAVALLVYFLWLQPYYTRIKPWHQSIVRVNDTVFDMDYFVKMLRLYGLSSTSDASSAESVATTIEDNELMKQGLKKDFDVVISDEAIEEKLQEMLTSYSMTADQLKTNLATMKISVEDFKQMYVEPSLVQSELQQQIGDQDYPADQAFEHVRVQALLVEGLDNATLMRTRWEDGEVFDTLAADNSVSKSRRDTAADNTTVEWVPKGIESIAFDNYAFSENPFEVLSNPIQDSDSSENYWVIKVLARESRPLSDADRDTLVSDAFSKWLEDAKNSDDNEIVRYLDDNGGGAKINWALAHV